MDDCKATHAQITKQQRANPASFPLAIHSANEASFLSITNKKSDKVDHVRILIL
jgi:hypothetical protein